MDNLAFINESNDVLTDSLRVAVKFEKDHSKVIRSIDDLLEKSYVIDTECNPKMDLHKMFCLCYDDIPDLRPLVSVISLRILSLVWEVNSNP